MKLTKELEDFKLDYEFPPNINSTLEEKFPNTVINKKRNEKKTYITVNEGKAVQKKKSFKKQETLVNTIYSLSF